MLFFVYMEKPSQTISLIWQNFLTGGTVLDLGCGRGHDSLFLVQNNFIVTAVDSSEVVINQLIIKQNELSLDNLELICGDIRDFEI